MKSPFEKPTGSDFEDMLNKNFKDVSWEEYDTDDGKMSYPFWKSMIASNGQTHADFMKWVASRKSVKMEDKTGVVKPKAEFDVDTTTKPTVVHDYKTTIVSKIAELSNTPKLGDLTDKTGVVKPKSEMGTQRKVDVTNQPKPTATGDLKDMTGVVKPKSEVSVNKVEVLPKAEKMATDLKDKTGVVKPEATFGKEPAPAIDNDFSTPHEPIVLMDFTEKMMDTFKKIQIED